MAANKKTLLLFILLHCFLVISQEANAQKYSANGRSGFTAEEQEFLKDLEEAKSRPGSYYDFLSEKWGLAAFNIHSFSTPSNLLGKILRPLGRWMQKRSTQKVLIQFEEENKGRISGG